MIIIKSQRHEHRKLKEALYLWLTSGPKKEGAQITVIRDARNPANVHFRQTG